MQYGLSLGLSLLYTTNAYTTLITPDSYELVNLANRQLPMEKYSMPLLENQTPFSTLPRSYCM